MAALRLSSGGKGEINILWYDPMGIRVSFYSVVLEESWFVTFHKPKIDRPIRPGVWTVKVELKGLGGPLLVQVNFLVVPLTHASMHVMTYPQAVNAKRVRPQGKEEWMPAFAAWKMNVSKVGTALEEWVDELVAGQWTLERYCRNNAEEGVGQSSCEWLPDCTSTTWSSLSPDPKSLLAPLSEVGADGRIR